MKNENFKKILAFFTALCLVLSVTLCLFPSLEVKASETINIKNTPFYSLIPKGDQLFDLQYYDISSASDLSDEIKYGCNDSIIPADGRAYYNFLPDFITFLNDKDNNSTQFNAGEPFNSINIVTNDSGLLDYLQNPNNYYSLVTITMNSSTFTLSVFYSDSNFLDNVYCSNGGGATFSFNGTIKRFDITFLITNDTSHSSFSPNVFTQSNSGSIPYMSSGYFLCYCTCPLYFVYANNQYGSTYSNLNSSSNIRTSLANGEDSPFLIDRRDYFSNYNGGNNITVDNDPLSQDYMGAWDIDLVPVGDLFNGEVKVKFVPSKRMQEYDGTVNIHYTFCLFFNGKKLNNMPILRNPIIAEIEGLYNLGAYKVQDFYIQPYMSCMSPSYQNNLTNEYTTFSASTILHSIDKTSSFYQPIVGNKVPIDAWYHMQIYKDLGYFNQTTIGSNAGASGQGLSIGVSSSNSGITRCALTVFAQAYYGDQQVTDIANATYDYFTGTVTKNGTVSTYNNTEVTPENSPTGFSPTEFENEIGDTLDTIVNDGGVKNVTGGSITGGNNTNTNNPTFTNNNNPTITINNNNGLTEPDGVPDDPNESSFSMLWSIWESYHFAEWLNQDLQGNGFLHYIFSSEIWDLPIFNLIIPALAILITVSIASTIIRFIRGN